MSEDRSELRERVLSLVRDGHTYQEVSEWTGLTRDAIAGIVFRDKQRKFKANLAALRQKPRAA